MKNKEQSSMVKAAIKIGQEKVRKGYVNDLYDEVSDIVFEICGFTEADYYGTAEIGELKKRLDKENTMYDMKFYKYEDRHLVECSFGEAMSTDLYSSEGAFIFSEMEDGEREFYVADIINS